MFMVKSHAWLGSRHRGQHRRLASQATERYRWKPGARLCLFHLYLFSVASDARLAVSSVWLISFMFAVSCLNWLDQHYFLLCRHRALSALRFALAISIEVSRDRIFAFATLVLSLITSPSSTFSPD